MFCKNLRGVFLEKELGWFGRFPIADGTAMAVHLVSFLGAIVAAIKMS